MGSSGEEDMSGVGLGGSGAIPSENSNITQEQPQQPLQSHSKDSSIDPQASSPSPNDEGLPASAPQEKDAEAVVNNSNSIDGVGHTASTASSTAEDNDPAEPNGSSSASPSKKDSSVSVSSSSKPALPPFVDDPNKITLKFIFANRDGLNVVIDCKPADTVGEVKGALLSMWPKELPNCSGGDKLRLICMGKGLLMPDSKSLQDCQVPVFKTHATPVNVSVKPENAAGSGSTSHSSKKVSILSSIGAGVSGGGGGGSGANASSGGGNGRSGSGNGGSNSNSVDTGCSCTLM